LSRELADPDESMWPGFRTLGQARRVSELRAYVDGSTYITRARCVAAGHFLRKGSEDVWLTCDDDVYADADVVAKLVNAARATRGLIALPYLNRDGGSMTFRHVRGPTTWVRGSEGPEAIAQDGIALRTVDRVGMGLVAMHRAFVSALDLGALHFEDDYPAIFLEGVQDVGPDGTGVWTGEDYWLCGLAERAGLPMHVLLDAPGEHAGRRAKLDLQGNILVAGEAEAQFLTESITRKEAEFRARSRT
jgi:hypothetical protein